MSPSRYRSDCADPDRICGLGRCKEAGLELSHDVDPCRTSQLGGACQETVTRVLNQFERDGIIFGVDSTVTILERLRLEKLAS